jgi:translation initiation factor 1
VWQAKRSLRARQQQVTKGASSHSALIKRIKNPKDCVNWDKVKMISKVDDDSSEPEFGELLRELDRSEIHIVIRGETRRFSKPTTLIQGIPRTNGELERVTHELKKKLATGGTSKDGQIVLQGDKREDAREFLVSLGYSSDEIEVL